MRVVGTGRKRVPGTVWALSRRGAHPPRGAETDDTLAQHKDTCPTASQHNVANAGDDDISELGQEDAAGRMKRRDATNVRSFAACPFVAGVVGGDLEPAKASRNEGLRTNKHIHTQGPVPPCSSPMTSQNFDAIGASVTSRLRTHRTACVCAWLVTDATKAESNGCECNSPAGLKPAPSTSWAHRGSCAVAGVAASHLLPSSPLGVSVVSCRHQSKPPKCGMESFP